MCRVIRGRLGAAVVSCVVLPVAGCGALKNPAEPDSATLAAAAAVCVEQTNQLRASVGAPPLVRSSEIDAFSDEAAQVDGEAHQAHKYFFETDGGHGVATAENVVPWWKVSDWGTVETVVRKGVLQMWAEGPNGSHTVNIRGSFTQIGCGIAVINGEVTVSQNFR